MSRRHHRGYSRPRGNWQKGSGTWEGDGPAGEDERPTHELVDGNHLMVCSASLYQGGPRTLETPHVLGFFSLDSEKNIHFDDSMMSSLSKKYMPHGHECMEVELDLNRSWHRVNGYTGTTSETFSQFLQWILKNQRKLTEDSFNKLMADFVCSRGGLKRIMQAPYAAYMFCDMNILAQYFKGSIYLKCEHEHQDVKKEQPSPIESYGHKFEQYMTGGDPDEVLECNQKFRCALKQHLNELTLLYPISTDAMDETRYQHNFKDMSSFVSLRTCIEFTEPLKQRNYKKFTLNGWWSDSQLSGIPRVLKGTRNREGVVHTLQMLETADFPDQAEGEWEPSVCINFLVKLLNFIKEKVVSEPHKVHCFKRSSKSQYFLHSHNTSETDILPKWYKQQLFVSEEENSD